MGLPSGELNIILTQMKRDIQRRCADRIEKAKHMSEGKIKIEKEPYGISSILKKKHGL